MKAVCRAFVPAFSFSFLGLRLIILAALITGPAALAAQTLSLDDYLNRVRDANQTLKVAASTIEAGELRSTSTEMIFSPQFFSQAAHTVDERESVNRLAPTRVEATSLSFGVQKLWEGGLQSQVSFNMTRAQLDQAALPSIIPVPLALPNPLVPGTTFNQIVNVPNPTSALLPPREYTEGRTQIDLSQPLLKNSGGADYALTRSATLTKIAMQKMGERYKVKSLIAQAESVYWQVALAQEAVRTQEGSIARFRKIVDWARNRAQSQLGDKADLLQASSGLKVKLFELEQAKKERASIQRVFNTLRGIAGDKVEVDLVPLGSKALSLPREFAGKIPEDKAKAGDGEVKRLDVEIAKEAEKLAQLEIEQSREKYKAQLDVFSSVAFNALDKTPEQALPGALQSDHPTYVVGLKFSTPLDRGIINRDREGLIQAGETAKLDTQLKAFNAEQDWADLQAQLRESHVRLRLAEEIESAQKEKLDYERERLSIGRTTTYQILMFEQDFASSQLNTIKSKAEILSILARLKSFGDAS